MYTAGENTPFADKVELGLAVRRSLLLQVLGIARDSRRMGKPCKMVIIKSNLIVGKKNKFTIQVAAFAERAHVEDLRRQSDKLDGPGLAALSESNYLVSFCGQRTAHA